MPKILKDFSGKEKYDDLYKWSIRKDIKKVIERKVSNG